jgi:hypothetical protein
VNVRRKVAFAAGAIFTASYFLPAMDTSSGFACFDDCWRVLIRSDSSHALPLGAWLYYSAFVAANALFVFLFGAVQLNTSVSRVRLWLAAASLLQVSSWIVVNIVGVWHGEEFAPRIGYFLWLASFVLLYSAHRIRDETKSEPAAAKC